MVSCEQERFLLKRRLLVRAWPWVGAVLLAIIVGFWGWLFFAQPLLANPMHVLEAVRTQAIPADTLWLMAGILPLTVLATGVLLMILMLFLFAGRRNEKKLLDIIDALRADRDPSCQTE